MKNINRQLSTMIQYHYGKMDFAELKIFVISHIYKEVTMITNRGFDQSQRSDFFHKVQSCSHGLRGMTQAHTDAIIEMQSEIAFADNLVDLMNRALNLNPNLCTKFEYDTWADNIISPRTEYFMRTITDMDPRITFTLG